MGATALIDMAVIALRMLGWVHFDVMSESAANAVCGVLLFCGAVLAAAVMAGAARSPAAANGLAERLVRVGTRALPATGLLMLTICVAFIDDGLRTRTDSVWPLTRAAMWAFLGIAAVYVCRITRTPLDRVIDTERALSVILPGLLVVAAIALPMTAGLSPWYVTVMLVPAFSVLANIGIPAVAGISVALTINALEVTRDRGTWVSDVIGARKPLVLWLVAAKSVLLIASWFIYRAFTTDPVATLSIPDLLSALIAAAIAVVLLVINGRISIALPRHEAASRYSGVILGGALAVGFGSAMLLGSVAAQMVTRPWTLAGVCFLLALCLPTRRIRHPGGIAFAYLGIAVVGFLLAVVFAARPVPTSTRFDADARMDAILTAGETLAVVALAAATVWIIVASIRARRFGWLVYLGTVVVWIVVQSVSRATGFSEIWTFDVMLTGLLGVATVLLLLGLQRSIDGFEIVVVLVGTTLLIEVPMMAQFLPDRIAVPLAVIGVLSPGVALVGKALADMTEPAAQRRAVLQLATTALVYSLLSAGVWVNDLDVTQFTDLITAFATSALAIPILLLLIAAHQRQTAPSDVRD
ncbi:hypothetical protein EU78_03945 [Mycolicibacterium rufum]|nr:hypothetical protein EU78_03945 [Mycolicibacterium rufum]